MVNICLMYLFFLTKFWGMFEFLSPLYLRNALSVKLPTDIFDEKIIRYKSLPDSIICYREGCNLYFVFGGAWG